MDSGVAEADTVHDKEHQKKPKKIRISLKHSKSEKHQSAKTKTQKISGNEIDIHPNEDLEASSPAASSATDPSLMVPRYPGIAVAKAQQQKGSPFDANSPALYGTSNMGQATVSQVPLHQAVGGTSSPHQQAALQLAMNPQPQNPLQMMVRRTNW